MSIVKLEQLGAGVGYRAELRADFFADPAPDVSWIEVITENYLPVKGADTLPLQRLRELRGRYPLALHGVSLNLGSADPLDPLYLKQLAWLERELEPWIVSDHLCWTGVNRENLFDLLPLPSTREALEHVAGRIQRVQDLLQRPLAIENITYYARPSLSEMPEQELLAELVRRTGCRLLLDINNIYVNSVNLGIPPATFLSGLDLSSVAQVHLAGHNLAASGLLLDTHGAPVPEPVWQLYESLLPQLAHAPPMIERDQNIPEWRELEPEVRRLDGLFRSAAERAKGGRLESPRMAEPRA